MIKMIVCDMDGTLLNSKNELTPKTVAYLKECQAKGIIMVLASGRSYTRLAKYYKELEMEKYNSYLIEVNGSYLTSFKDKTRTRFEPMYKEDAKILYEATKDFGVEVNGFLDAGIRVYIPEALLARKIAYKKEHQLPEDYPLTGGIWKIIGDSRDGYPDQYQIKDMEGMPDKMNKVVLLHDPEIIEKVTLRLQKLYADKYEFCRSSPRLIEITKKGVTKGNALLKLMEITGVKDDEILCFGDGENDYSMFDVVKYPIVMKNAPEYVKAHAFEVTEYTNNEDGIYYECLKYID